MHTYEVSILILRQRLSDRIQRSNFQGHCGLDSQLLGEFVLGSQGAFMASTFLVLALATNHRE